MASTEAQALAWQLIGVCKEARLPPSDVVAAATWLLGAAVAHLADKTGADFDGELARASKTAEIVAAVFARTSPDFVQEAVD